MSRVRILDDLVVNQIAAGEVVERPVSVVKELIENAIDAGATKVHIVIANGGRSSIQVIDDGSGMSKSDALLAIERFGTSKINSVDDIQEIATLGFRGEALPSIASVSRFSLSSKTASEKGVEITIDGGVIKDVVDKDAAPGTRIEVKNLFFNVPARRRFLRAERTEAGLIKALVSDMALSFPKVRFILVSDGKEVRNFSKSASFFERVKQLKLFKSDPIVVEESRETVEGKISVLAYLSQPSEAVSSALRLRLIVNGRSVRDKLLLRAIRDAFGTFLKPGKYPVGVIKLEVPASEVDVNVHPQKSEVRFRTPDLVYSSIHSSIKKALTETSTFDLLRRDHGFQDVIPIKRENSTSFNQQIVFEGNTAPRIEEERELVMEKKKVQKLSKARYLGQIFHCYLLMEGAGEFCVVDMHAAHERVTFYKLKKQFLEKTVAAQNFLVPELITLPSDRIEQFESFKPILEDIGIDAELFSDDQVAVRSLPALLGGVSAESIFNEFFALPSWSDWKEELEVKIDRVISRIACHGSVRSGRDLKAEEVYALLEDLEAAESSAFCPHGRPVVIKLSEYELECMFDRA